MKVYLSKGAIKLVAENDYEVKTLQSMIGKTYCAANWCTPHTTKALKKDGIVDLYLDEVKESVSLT